MLLATGTLGHNPTFVLISLGAAVTAFLLRWLPLDLAVAAAPLLLLSGAVAAGTAAAVVRMDLLGRPVCVVLGYVVLVLLVACASVLRPASSRSTWIAGPGWLAVVPSVVALAVGVRQSLNLAVAKSWAFESTDLVRHMMLLKTQQRAGYLDYGGSLYPRGWHMLEALVAVPDAPLARPTKLLAYDLRLTAAVVWLALALVLWVGAATVMRIGHALAWEPRRTVTTALLLGVVLLMTNNFVLTFVYMGAAPSLAAAAVIGTLPLFVLSGLPALQRTEGILAATACQAMLLAHLWQALVIVPLVVFVTCAMVGHRTLLAALRGVSPRRGLYRAALVCLPAALLAASPLLRLTAQGGIGIASIPGALPEPPWRLAAGVICLAAPLVIRRRRALWSVVVTASALGLIAVTGMLLAGADHGLDLTQYYPLKSTWFLLVVLAPVLAIGAMDAAVWVTRSAMLALGRTGRPAGVLRVTSVATAIALIGAFWLPTALNAGSATWATTRAPVVGQHPGTDWLQRSRLRYNLAVRYHRAYPRDVVVPYFVGQSAAFDGFTNRMVSELLAFQTDGMSMTRDGQDPCGLIADLAGRRSAVIISKLPVRRVHLEMAQHGCAGRAPVVHVPGGITDVALMSSS